MLVLPIGKGQYNIMSKAKIKKAALQLIAENGLVNLTRASVCERAGVNYGSFIHHIGYSFEKFYDELDETVTDSRVHKITKKRLRPHLRNKQIRDCSREIYKQGVPLTKKRIAEEAGVSEALVAVHIGSLTRLYKELKNEDQERSKS